MSVIDQPPTAQLNTDSKPGYFKANEPGFMGEEQVQFYQDNGYLVAEDALAEEEVQALTDEATAICRGDRGEYAGQVGSHEGQTEDEVLRNYLCIHWPHKISELMRQTMAHPATKEVLTNIIGPNVKAMQSMLFIKPGGKPGQPWHQDEGFIPTRDRSLCGGWLALDDATTKNGCLWVIPGSHKYGILWPRHAQNDPQFDCSGEAGGFPYTDEDAIPVEVKRGSVLFFNGYLLHRSLPNYTESNYRRVLVNHYMSCESLLPWRKQQEGDGSLAFHDHRDIEIIAGQDPYAYNGYQDLMKPHVRPDGEGGCDDGSKKKDK